MGTCFLDFDGAMMLEKESNFLEVNVSLDSGRPRVLRVCIFLAGSRALFTRPVWILVNVKLNMGPMALFTHLKTILLQCFQFSAISGIQTNTQCPN